MDLVELLPLYSNGSLPAQPVHQGKVHIHPLCLLGLFISFNSLQLQEEERVKYNSLQLQEEERVKYNSLQLQEEERVKYNSLQLQEEERVKYNILQLQEIKQAYYEWKGEGIDIT